MTDTLIIYLPEFSSGQAQQVDIDSTIAEGDGDLMPDLQQAVEWALLDTEQKRIRVSGQGELPGLLPLLTEKYPESRVTKTIALIPGSQVLFKSVSIPSKQSRHIAKAIPYMLEDFIANDIEQNFYAIGKPDNQGQVPVAVIEKTLIDHYFAVLHQHGIAADVITTDLLMVPYDASMWTLLLGHTSAWVRTTLNAGIVINLAAMPPVLETVMLAAQDEVEIKGLKVIEAENSDSRLFESDTWQNILQQNKLSVEHQPTDYSEFEIFCANYLADDKVEKQLINFCQGEYRPKSTGLALGFNWKPVAVLLSLLVLIYISGSIYQQVYYQSKAKDFKQASIKLYREYFPEDKRIVNIRVQTNNHLQKLSGGSGNKGFMPLLYNVGDGLRQIQNKNNKTISLTRISFDNKLGDLRIDLVAKDFTTLEKYKQKLMDGGLMVDITSAVSGEQGVQARIKVASGTGTGGQG